MQDKYVMRKQSSSTTTRTTYFIPCHNEEEFNKQKGLLPKECTKLFLGRSKNMLELPSRDTEDWIAHKMNYANGKPVCYQYRCFQNISKSEKNVNLILHEDVKSSINCLLETTKHPEYGIVYYETINKEVTNE